MLRRQTLEAICWECIGRRLRRPRSPRSFGPRHNGASPRREEPRDRRPRRSECRRLRLATSTRRCRPRRDRASSAAEFSRNRPRTRAEARGRSFGIANGGRGNPPIVVRIRFCHATALAQCVRTLKYPSGDSSVNPTPAAAPPRPPPLTPWMTTVFPLDRVGTSLTADAVRRRRTEGAPI